MNSQALGGCLEHKQTYDPSHNDGDDNNHCCLCVGKGVKATGLLFSKGIRMQFGKWWQNVDMGMNRSSLREKNPDWIEGMSHDLLNF